jgi:hypothetical protein
MAKRHFVDGLRVSLTCSSTKAALPWRKANDAETLVKCAF